MDRRELIKLGAASLVGACTGTGTSLLAQSTAAAEPAGNFQLDVYSRDLQWLRTPADLAKAVQDIGLSSVDLTVLSYPGHVDPTKVKTDLPSFVSGLKKEGVAVRAITTPITDASTPMTEAILDTASSVGIPYYGFSGFRYDSSSPYRAQLEALKPRLEKLVNLNEKCKIKGLYQPASDPDSIGLVFFDLLEVMQNFNPQHIGFRYDTGALLQATPQTTAIQLRLGGPYIGGVAINDAVVRLELPKWNEGPYSDNHPEILNYGDGGGDNTGKDGGNPLAIGGGGRRLPFKKHPVPPGTGMVDLESLGKVLKQINFNGPAECQTEWVLGGAETGADKITLPRQTVIGGIKHNRLMVEQAFASSWNIDIAQPDFMKPAGSRQAAPSRRNAGSAPD